MPHLTLEYTSNLGERLPSRELFVRIHRMLSAVAGIRVENCKGRWREVEGWVVGEGNGNSGFVHLNVRFLEGRTLEVQRAVGEEALEILKAHFLPPPEGVALQITVEVQEIRKSLYAKDPPGTLTPPPFREA